MGSKPGAFRRFVRKHAHNVRVLRNGRAAQRKLAILLRELPEWHRWRRKARTASTPRRADASLLIAFVSSQSRPRLFKLAHAVNRAGHRVSLISGARYNPAELEAFESYKHASNPWDILDALEEMSPDVVHLFGNYDNFSMLPVGRFAPAPVVFDPYDVLRGMITPKWQKDWVELRAERMLFETADHVCARHLEPLVLKRRFGYAMPAATFFPDYCWRRPAIRKSKSHEGLHVVYCGNVKPEDRHSKDEVGYAQYIDIGRKLAVQEIHLHIYPAIGGLDIAFDEYFALYLKENELNSFFHFHRPVPYGELIERIGHYDAALHVVDGSYGRVTEEKLNYSTANKLFDYIEAGLPVIIHRGLLQRSIARRCGTAVTVDSLDNIRPRLERVLASHRDPISRCDLEYHWPRLGAMYERVASGRQSRSVSAA